MALHFRSSVLERHAHLFPHNEAEQAEKLARSTIRLGHAALDRCEADLRRWADAAVTITGADYTAGQEHFKELVEAKLNELRALIVQPLEVAVEGRARIREIEGKLSLPTARPHRASSPAVSAATGNLSMDDRMAALREEIERNLEGGGSD